MRKIREAVEFLKSRAPDFEPEITLVLGSGLGFLSEMCRDSIVFKYEDIPNFPKSTAPGHIGELVFGLLSGKRVAIMRGRFHYYEGYSFEEAAFGVRTLRLLGSKTLLVTNAAGGITLRPGTIMLISDHIKFSDASPLRGPNISELGVRFPDMSSVYTPNLRKVAKLAAGELNIGIAEGVYMFAPGPQYETPAEIRAMSTLGADAVGMSTVPEVIAARHCSMEILGFSLICNMAAGLGNYELSEEEVLNTAERCKEIFSKLILRCLEDM